MEAWQKTHIAENLTRLASYIKCNALLQSNLFEAGALADVDVEILKAKALHGEDHEKSTCLLEILITRPEGYLQLAKSLQTCNQTDAFDILLKGIQKHVLSKDVIFQGSQLPLEDICKLIGAESMKKIISQNVDTTNYEQFLSHQRITVAVSTEPDTLPYYIPRTLSINNCLDHKIFDDLGKDIFCIEGIQLYQLSELSKKKCRYTPDRSSNQIYALTAQFILLEHPDHFQEIANKTENTVHWIKHTNDEYFYVKSSTGSGIQAVKKYLIQRNSKRLTEEEFLLRCHKSPRNVPVLLYDSPGNGKSVLLASLARQNKCNHQNVTVIYLEVSKLISKFLQLRQEISSVAIKQVLLESCTTNRFGTDIMSALLDTTDYYMEVFLDAFDEVSASDLKAVHKILGFLAANFKNIRMFITTRPHRRQELESKFGVLGYNILPFDNSNKLSFFLKFWENQHGIERIEEMKQFAENCIKTVLSEVSSEESDIAGVPLQCRMLAEIFAENAKMGGLIPPDLKFQLNSIFQVYKHFIDTKFSRICTDEEKKICYDFHVTESLHMLFPNCKRFYKSDRVPENESIRKIGILEPLKSDSSILLFLHGTLAEFIAAEYFATVIFSESDKEKIDFFFQQVLMWFIDDRGEATFQNPSLCRFLNFFLSTMHLPGQDFGTLKKVLRESKHYNSETLVNLLECSLKINSVHLYCFLLDIFLGLDQSTNKATGLLRFKQNLPGIQNSPVKEEEAKKVKLISTLKINSKIETLVCTAAKYSSLNLMKLSCELLESVTEKNCDSYCCRVPMHLTMVRGHYEIFEYLLSFDKSGFFKQPLLHWCLRESYGKDVGGKVRILNKILCDRRDFLNKPHIEYFSAVPLLVSEAHFSLIKCLIDAGADLTPRNFRNENIAHTTAYYFSAEEYHELVELIISRNTNMLFKQRDIGGLTPVHRALMWIDLKSETLELLAKLCKVNFNDNFPELASELAVAIERGSSERVIKDIIRLGGNMKKLKRGICSVV